MNGMKQAKAIEPEFLGPLGERRLAEMARKSSPEDLFPGAQGFLSRRMQSARRVRWEAAQERLSKLLRPDEHVLYVAQATQTPPGLQAIGLGHLTYAYHQVLLVFTDSRLIEVLLNVWGKTPATRLRSYEWRHVDEMKQFFRRLTVKPLQGAKQSWSLQLGGDKKMVALLMPKLKSKMRLEGAAGAKLQPTWHCPKCAAANQPSPERCAGCGTMFASRKLAVALSLAIPGAGLFYLGHPMLGVMHFCVEMLLFFAAFMGMVDDGGSLENPAPLVAAAVLIVIAKLSTLAAVNILAPRTVPDREERRPLLWKLSLAGGLLTVLAIAGAGTASARMVPRLDHDLDLSAKNEDWTVSRKPAEWEVFKDNADARSEWTHKGGLLVTVFGYPLKAMEDPAQFKRDYEEAMRDKTSKLVREDEKLPGSFTGFRQIRQTTNSDGKPVALLQYFLYDTDGNDVHQVLAAVPAAQTELAEELLDDFLGHAHWVEPIPPQR